MNESISHGRRLFVTRHRKYYTGCCKNSIVSYSEPFGSYSTKAKRPFSNGEPSFINQKYDSCIKYVVCCMNKQAFYLDFDDF